MLPPLFGREPAGEFAGFRGQAAPGRGFRVIKSLSRRALLLFHRHLNLPFPEEIVNTGT
jgi:hypothetical protein